MERSKGWNVMNRDLLETKSHSQARAARVRQIVEDQSKW